MVGEHRIQHFSAHTTARVQRIILTGQRVLCLLILHAVTGRQINVNFGCFKNVGALHVPGDGLGLRVDLVWREYICIAKDNLVHVVVVLDALDPALLNFLSHLGFADDLLVRFILCERLDKLLVFFKTEEQFLLLFDF